MKKTLPIITIISSVLIVGAGAFALANNRLSVLKADDNIREASITIDYTWLSNISSETGYASFDLVGKTQSGYDFTATNCYAAGDTFALNNIVDSKHYIFTADSQYAGNSYFDLNYMVVSNYYSFSSVEVNGVFTNSKGTNYRYTYDLANPGTQPSSKVIEYDDGAIWINVGSGSMDNNYSKIYLESIVIRYSCLD